MSWLLLDIEGTVSPIAFVRQILFPYASKALPAFVAAHADDVQVREWLQTAAQDMPAAEPDDADIVRQLQQWIAEDRKHTALKALQGEIWAQGYTDGEYQAPVYPDAVAFMRQWHADGGDIAIYSSGSVPAQKLLFRYSDAGDLNPLLSAYFDTAVGAKQMMESYLNIIDALDAAAAEITFCSDVFGELDAAHQAGLHTVLVDRREDYAQTRTLPAGSAHQRIESFDDFSSPSGAAQA
jgi:enolase-phosphatase E1